MTYGSSGATSYPATGGTSVSTAASAGTGGAPASVSAAYQEALNSGSGGSPAAASANDSTVTPVPFPFPANEFPNTAPTPVQTAPQQVATTTTAAPGQPVTVGSVYQQALSQSAQATLGTGGVNQPSSFEQTGSSGFGFGGDQFVPGLTRPAATIFFTDGGTGLGRADREVLRQISLLQAQTGDRIRIVGHASPTGQPAANQRISLQRADVVAQELIRLGVGRDAILIAGVGSNQVGFAAPISGDAAAQRRAEIYLIN